MRVLDVEDGILGRLLLGEFEIEIELAVGFAEQKEKSHDVGADFVDQLVECDVGRLARGHFHFLASARERDELVDNRVDGSDVVAERLDGGDDLLVLGDVIGAEDVHDQIETALELLDVIGDVGRAISRLTSGPERTSTASLGSPSGSPRRPYSAVLLEGEAGVVQSLQDIFNLARVEEIKLVGEDVEADSEARAGLIDVGEDGFDSHRAESLEIGHRHERIAPVRFQRARDVDDVLALVAVRRHRRFDAVRLQITYAD